MTKARGHFPGDDAVVKLLWLAIINIEDKRARTFPGRLNAVAAGLLSQAGPAFRGFSWPAERTDVFKFRNRNPAARRPAPAPPLAGNGPAGAERATFGAGCFWGVEAAFRQIDGVRQTAAGYTGGHAEHPTYRQVCGHRTGHAEAVEVWFDPARVSCAQLLKAFWRMHNPTTRNRQGWDLGSQYRSAIFFHSPAQEALAIASRDAQQESLARPIVTQITPASAFYRAEEYHQRYLENHGHPSCAVTVRQRKDPVTGGTGHAGGLGGLF